VGTHALGPVPELPLLDPPDEVPELPLLDPPDDELAPLLPLELAPAPASTLGASSSTRPPQATATSIETNAT